MTQNKSPQKPPSSSSRETRVAEALRENLRKRKQKQQLRQDGSPKKES